MRAPAYVAFDLIWLNGIDLRALPLTERRRHLQNILPKGSTIISEALSVMGRGHQLFELMCAHDLEGVVAKRLSRQRRTISSPHGAIASRWAGVVGSRAEAGVSRCAQRSP
jgi:ATP dependent DNA ligase domain